MARKPQSSHEITVEDVRRRLLQGVNFMSAFVLNDQGACSRFLDASTDAGANTTQQAPASGGVLSLSDITEVGEVVGSVPMGTGSAMTVNHLTKLAATAVNDPDWHVVAKRPSEPDEMGFSESVDDPDSAEVGRQYLRQVWEDENVKGVFEMALLKTDVSGHGFIFYSWDTESRSAKFEHVHSWDIAVDPFIKDWQKPEWVGRAVFMSLRQANKRYPNTVFAERLTKDRSNGDTEKVKIWIYWDKKNEFHLWDKGDSENSMSLLNKGKTKNEYGRVPWICMEGDIHPGSTPFRLGLAVIAAGAQAEYADMNLHISNAARHGAPLLTMHPGSLADGQKDKIRSGRTQEIIEIAAAWDPNSEAIHRIPGENLSPAVLEAKRESRNDMDGLMGIGAGDRGLFDQKPEFASEIAYVAQKGGARQNRSKKKYEADVNKWGKRAIWLYKENGGAYKVDGVDISTDEEKALHEALSNVTEVYVLEGSTLFKDPGMEQQQSLQLVQTLMQNMPMYLTMNSMGLINKIPDVTKATDRLFRAFGVNQTEQMWIQAQVPPPPQEDSGEDPQAEMQKEQMGIAGDLEKQGRDHAHEVKMELIKHALTMNELSAQQRHQQALTGAQMQNAKQIAAMKPKPNGAKK